MGFIESGYEAIMDKIDLIESGYEVIMDKIGLM